jgi:peptidoglycan/LPS O-acetylase OafA/YrhL
MRLVGWFLLLVGVAIAGLWALLLVTGQVPEVEAGRIDIWFHIAAEVGAAALLVVAGLMVLRDGPHARVLAGMALGALAYTATNSAGYYAEADEWPVVAMFAVILLTSILAASRLVRPSRSGAAPRSAEVTRS